MGTNSKFDKTKLIIGVLISQFDLQDQVIDELRYRFGPIDFQSPLLDFTFSHYYDREMGTPIKKFFLSFEKLVYPDSLYTVKLITNEIESKYFIEGFRKVNIDPGHMFLSRFILTTTKDGSHRIPLHSGIFAEVTVMYEKNTFRPMEWTYPDFRSKGYVEILNHIRNIYKQQLSNET